MADAFDALSDGFEAFNERRAEQSKRDLAERAAIRKKNVSRPRCACCHNDVPRYRAIDVVSQETFDDPAFDWLEAVDLRPGDIVCFWCEMDMHELHDRFQWGRA